MTATTATRRPVPKRAKGALTTYRVMAWITGTMLCVLVFVGFPLEYAAHQHWVGYLWALHGWLFVIYLVAALYLGTKMRWNPFRLVIIMLCGTIPVLTFVAEHNTTKHARAAGVV